MVAAMLLAFSPSWTPMFMISDEMLARGVKGGEGGQWPRTIAASGDGKTMFLGIDVGGIFRSLDGGESWHQASVGFSPRGAVSIAIDPKNSDRVIVIGANSLPMDHHGVWLSTNRGASWKSVHPVRMSGLSDFRDQIAFDPNSFDTITKRCKRVIWSRIGFDKPNWGDTIDKPALYESNDGGDTWAELPNSGKYADGFVRFSPGIKGVLIIGNKHGLFWQSNSKWNQTSTDGVTGLDVSDSAVIATTRDEIRTYAVSALGLKLLGSSKSPAPTNYELRNIKVSPREPNRMVMWTEPVPNNWDWRRYSSDDGGKTWQQATLSQADSFLPGNARQGLFAWNPVNPKVVFSLGGDWITKSTDGGLTFKRSNAGQGGILAGGSFQFCANDPDVCFFGSQDYNGAMTTNGGKSWKYLNPSGNGWGGFTYGGYALDKSTLWVGDAPGWGGPRRLKVSKDSGKTWTDTGLDLKGMDISNGIPGSAEIGFASDLRTGDAGKTWSRMVGCQGVVSYSAATKQAVGINKTGDSYEVVVSSDQGKTWKVAASTTAQIYDALIHPTTKELLIAAGDLYRLSGSQLVKVETPKDEFGNRNVKTVAVDPANPNLIYIGNNANVYSPNNAVCRSVDGGKSWSVISRRTALEAGEQDGGRETFWIRIHPKTREAWCATSCYGWWKTGP
ncbi:MAG: hypothetical protein WCK51_01755 [Armatimonadota bacterium]